jgi:hypothetical protein
MLWLSGFFMLVLVVYAGICLAFYFLQERLLFIPFFASEKSVKRLHVNTREFIIPTAEDGQIHALLLRANQAKGLVFYLHGNTGGIGRWKFEAQEICLLGFDVFVMDYRGYGRSRGKRSEALMHRDVDMCFDFAQKTTRAINTFIYGRSLGCAFATHLAARVIANGLVLETPFYNLPRLAKHFHPYLPLKWLMRYSFRSDHFIRRVEMPIILFHGTHDDLVPYHHAYDLYLEARHVGRDIRFVTLIGGHHSDLVKFESFVKKRADFLNAITIE